MVHGIHGQLALRGEDALGDELGTLHGFGLFAELDAVFLDLAQQGLEVSLCAKKRMDVLRKRAGCSFSLHGWG
jgi:hypothetical protein